MRAPSHPPIQPLLTVAEVAHMLNVSFRTIRRLIAARELKVIRVGRAIRISQAAVHDYVTAAAGK
jgi:excisionase family DNA binding protein